MYCARLQRCFERKSFQVRTCISSFKRPIFDIIGKHIPTVDKLFFGSDIKTGRDGGFLSISSLRSPFCQDNPIHLSECWLDGGKRLSGIRISFSRSVDIDQGFMGVGKSMDSPS